MTAHSDSLPAVRADHADAGHEHGSRRSYLIGFLLSVVLTAVPFWLAMTGVLEVRTTALIVVALAVAQILVHTVFFLHVNTRAEGGWTLLAIVFTAVLIVIVIAGSLWIMYHLHGNMMPAPPRAQPPVPIPSPAAAPLAG